MYEGFGLMQNDKIRVRAPEGKTCPWPGRPGETIGANAVHLSKTRLVRRLVADGSLIPAGAIITNDSKAAVRRKPAAQGKKE